MSDLTLTLKLAEELAALRQRVAELERIERPRFIGACCTTDAGQSVPHATLTTVNFEDVEYDPLGLVTTGAGWTFRAPVAGQYLVTGALLFTAATTWSPGEAVQVSILRNGATFSNPTYRDNWPSGATLYAGANWGRVVPCAAGDTLTIQVYQTSGGTIPLQASAAFNYVSIVRL